jgi:zinc transporter 1/2/3
LPLYFANNVQGTIILNYANPFSGGIFIGIGLFHLLPDASYNFEQYYKTPEGKSSFFYGFPMSYFIVFLSYSFILFLEKVAFSSQEKDGNKNDLILNKEILEPLLEEQNKENMDENNEKIISSILYKRNKGKSNIIFIYITLFLETMNKKDKANNIANIIINKEEKEKDKDNVIELNDNMNTITNEKNKLTPYVLLIALSLHGIFEGIALGVINNNSEGIILFVAILAHKWAESFALGISFYNAGIQTRIFIEMLIIFTFFTPVGILIGMYFSKSGLLMEGIMLSISSGTFVYVSTSEIIVEEFSSKGSKYLKFFIYLIGGFLTVFLNILEPLPISK